MKVKEIRELNEQEIRQKYQEIKEELFNLKVQQSVGQIEKPLKIRVARRDIAKIKTIACEKNIKL